MRSIPPDDQLYARLRDSTIDRIHRHVIPVEGAPSQGYLREVSRSDHWRVVHISEVHQYLRTLTCLRILKGRILPIALIVDGREMLLRRLLDIYLTDRHAQRLHHSIAVAIGALGGAKARHRYRNDLLAI